MSSNATETGGVYHCWTIMSSTCQYRLIIIAPPTGNRTSSLVKWEVCHNSRAHLTCSNIVIHVIGTAMPRTIMYPWAVAWARSSLQAAISVFVFMSVLGSPNRYIAKQISYNCVASIQETNLKRERQFNGMEVRVHAQAYNTNVSNQPAKFITGIFSQHNCFLSIPIWNQDAPYHLLND